jgi:hypothetical protein
MATNNEVNTNAQVPKVVIIKAGLEAIIPTKGSASAAGYDLYTPTDFTLTRASFLLCRPTSTAK